MCRFYFTVRIEGHCLNFLDNLSFMLTNRQFLPHRKESKLGTYIMSPICCAAARMSYIANAMYTRFATKFLYRYPLFSFKHLNGSSPPFNGKMIFIQLSRKNIFFRKANIAETLKLPWKAKYFPSSASQNWAREALLKFGCRLRGRNKQLSHLILLAQGCQANIFSHYRANEMHGGCAFLSASKHTSYHIL
jgi:hypothetical protein